MVTQHWLRIFFPGANSYKNSRTSEGEMKRLQIFPVGTQKLEHSVLPVTTRPTQAEQGSDGFT